MAIIDAAVMEAPRLELRWERTGKTWWERECAYNLVIPLREHDMRREDENGHKKADCQVVELGRTKVTGSGFMTALENGYIETPFRDGSHAKWDSEALGGLPVYAVLGGRAMLVERKVAS